MPNQENPNITFVNVRVTQELCVKARKLAETRGMRGGAAELARHLLSEECMGVELTASDYDEIKRRIDARKEQIKRAEEKKED
jgi:hypothetical protein